jgi:hypothetical protein
MGPGAIAAFAVYGYASLWWEESMSIVRALPSAKDGRALLELRNDWSAQVTVKEVLWLPLGDGWGSPLVRVPQALSPGESRAIDITDALGLLLNRYVAESTFRILLPLDPEPPSQPGPGTYTARFTRGRCESFRSG